MFELQPIEVSNTCEIAQKILRILCDKTKILHVAQRVLKNVPNYTINNYRKDCPVMNNCKRSKRSHPKSSYIRQAENLIYKQKQRQRVLCAFCRCFIERLILCD